ncbi:DUF3048 domain-containing protein [Nakamurella lactea]|uniref:DUF3048 domain-containing protein n=1 Tax=Nakamurella lactea TaxID=459515 RepID=UPI00041A18E4|nr:DUF3048 domain-containing protein [Nakamurella lactea]
MQRRLIARALIVLIAVAVLAGCTTATGGSGAAAPGDLAALAASASSAAEQSRAALAARQEAAARAIAAAKARAAAAKAKATKAAAAKAAAKAKAAQLAKAKAEKAAAAKAKAAKLAAAKARAAAARSRAAAAKAAAARIDPLTGRARSRNPVIAVKLDNTSAGRPQFGVDSADIVYVEEVEGGLTRLIALFHTTLPTEVGPVRSVRSTDTQLLPAYGRPLLVYSGGAGGPLSMLAASRVTDAAPYAATWRSGAKPAPYNLHANLQQVASAYRAAAGHDPALQAPGMQFQSGFPKDQKWTSGPSVDVRIGNVHTAFQWTGKGYRVMPAGAPGTAANGTPLIAQNVLVQRVHDDPDGTVDSVGSPSMLTRTVGGGEFVLYRNGRATTGRWSRGTAESPTGYRDSAGRQVKFAPGKTWVLLVPQSGAVNGR